jgi:hypothetical protein
VQAFCCNDSRNIVQPEFTRFAIGDHYLGATTWGLIKERGVAWSTVFGYWPLSTTARWNLILVSLRKSFLWWIFLFIRTTKLIVENNLTSLLCWPIKNLTNKSKYGRRTCKACESSLVISWLHRFRQPRCFDKEVAMLHCPYPRMVTVEQTDTSISFPKAVRRDCSTSYEVVRFVTEQE